VAVAVELIKAETNHRPQAVQVVVLLEMVESISLAVLLHLVRVLQVDL
jgi:hypothetical protein